MYSSSERNGYLPIAPRTLGVLLGIFACFYAIELTSLPLSIDDELASARIDSTPWIAQGRWTTYLVERFLLPEPVLPFVPIAIFGLALSLAYVFLLRGLRQNPDSLAALVTFPLFAAFPIWSFLTEFQSNTPAAGFGVLACCLAIHRVAPIVIADRPQTIARSMRGLTVAVLLVAFAIGAYQSMLMLFVVLGFGATVFLSVNTANSSVRMLFRSVAVVVLVSVVAVALYYTILTAFRSFLGAGPEYIDNFVKLSALRDQPFEVLGRSAAWVWNTYTGSVSIYGVFAWAFGLVVLSAFVSLAVTPELTGRPALRVLLIGLSAAMLIVPFAMNPISNGTMPLRALIGVPAAIWMCGYLAITTPVLWLNRTALVAVAISIFQTLYSVYLFQVNSVLVRQHDAVTAGAIYQRIAELQPDWTRTKSYRVAIYGAWVFETSYPRIESSTAGASFFEWDNGNPYREVAFMKLLGFKNLEVAAPDLRESLKEIARAMPVWPAQGSVKVVNDVTIVKMGDIQ